MILTIEIPLAFKSLELTDRQFVFVNFMHRLRNHFGFRTKLRMYGLDVKTMVSGKERSQQKITKILEPFNGLIDGIDADTETWYMYTTYPKCAQYVQSIQDPQAIALYYYLLGRTAGDRYEDENSKTMDQFLVERRETFGTHGNILYHDEIRFLK